MEKRKVEITGLARIIFNIKPDHLQYIKELFVKEDGIYGLVETTLPDGTDVYYSEDKNYCVKVTLKTSSYELTDKFLRIYNLPDTVAKHIVDNEIPLNEIIDADFLSEMRPMVYHLASAYALKGRLNAERKGIDWNASVQIDFHPLPITEIELPD